MSTHLIKLEEAGKRYLSHRFTIEVSNHDFFVISGGNGTGKTTLLMMILGFIDPDCGMIEKRRLKIGYVPEKVVLPPHVEVFDYLKTMARIKHDRIDLSLVHLFEVPIDKRIHELSKGNQQKLALMTAFMGKPNLLILDEPLSGLDDLMQDRVIGIIKMQFEKGLSVMVSTHEPERFMPYATKHVAL